MPATYEKIATTTLGSTTTSFSFNSIPATYTDLRLVMVSILQTSLCIPGIRFNGLSTNIMSQTDLYGNGTSALSSSNTNSSRVIFGPAAQTTSTPAFYTCDIFSYAGSTNKTFLIASSNDTNGSGFVNRTVGLWGNTSAISSLTILEAFGNGFAIGTTATLYGILKA